ncbi:MAG: large conductance mechanosensitive channel protein MscL [Oscillospiraceae bacterium]|nr:large conductance mechanosensitive channel protein MscL [Oscillospiraceae bacterium]
MKSFISEFKEFISKGNVMDLAVGVIIGGAFQSIVNSLVNDIIMPILGAIFGGLDFSAWAITLGKGENAAQLTYGNFISAVINFLLMALVLFSVIKAMNKAKNLVKKPAEEAPAAPTTKKCPYCFSEIDIKATRCPHCTSEIK